jgi:hypothetical protein
MVLGGKCGDSYGALRYRSLKLSYWYWVLKMQKSKMWGFLALLIKSMNFSLTQRRKGAKTH